MESIVFNRGMKDIAGTKPQKLRLGDWYCEPLTWAKAMEMTAKSLLCDIRYRDRLLKNIRSIRGFDAVSAGMHLPRRLEPNLYIECNKSANNCLRTIRLMLEAAEYPSGEASVEYEAVQRKETEEPASAQSFAVDDVATAPSQSTPMEKPHAKPAKVAKTPLAKKGNDNSVSPQIEEKVVNTYYEISVAELLEAEFPNGVRPGSIIDRNKIRRAYLQWFDEELPSDLDLESLLLKVGLFHDGKVFPVSRSTDHSPELFVKSLEGRSHGIFFYDELFEKEAESFTQLGVQSGEMLRTVLKKMSHEAYVYGRVSFTPHGRPATMEDVLEAAFKTKGEWSRGELESYFPYVPADKIVAVLAQDGRFVRVAEGTYRLLADILLDENECQEVSRMGFFSMTADAFRRSIERNGDISPSAIQTAFFERFLSDRFDRHGKIVCAKGAPFDSKMAIRAFCRDNDEVTLDELLQMERECDLGGGNRSIVTAHEELVRVSEERFVAPRLVSFDVVAVDAALESLVPPSGVLPLVSVRSFVSFPPLSGWEWNVYLLEGFLRRASASFAFLSVSAAPRTACGAIVRRSAGFPTIIDALARAVVEAGVSTNEKEVGGFLIAQGYIQRRRGVEKDVAEMARRLTQSESEGDAR